MTYSSSPVSFPSVTSILSPHLSGLRAAEYKEVMREQIKNIALSSWLLKFRKRKSWRKFGDYIKSESNLSHPSDHVKIFGLR